jgi:pentatricopeptide repeat protein
MSLGGHIVRRGRAALSASGGLFTTPREPLLFLYSQWIRTAATAAQDQAVGGSQKTLSIGSDHLSNNTHIPELGSIYENAILEPSEYGNLLEEKQGSTPQVQEALSQGAYPTQNGNEPTDDQVQQPSENKETIVKELDGEGNAGLVAPTEIIRRILAVDEKRIAQRMYNRRTREDYEEMKSRKRIAGESDWRDILATLERHTPDGASHWHDNVLRIRVPFKVVGRLLFSEEDNIWAIKMRCGCQIEVSEADEASQGRRIFLISGPVRNITKAAVEILQVAPGAVPDKEIWSQHVPGFKTKPPQQRPSLSVDSSSTDVVRSVRADRRRRMAAPIRADKVPRPSTWTPESFGLHVQHLISIKMTTHMQRILYKPGEYHTNIVVDILQTLFVDPECRTAISAAAFNDALGYLQKHNAIDVVRDLYVRMEMQNLKMNTETFNIMLRGTAKSRSLGNFHYIFLLMLRRGYTPNVDTWLAFMRLVDDFEIKVHILKSMKSKELLRDPRTQKGVCENLVQMEIHDSLDNNMTHEQFLQHMADRYGQDWLTKDSASRILDALGSRGLISRCWEFFEFMHTQDVKPSDVSILTVIHHCEKQRNVEGAIEIIRRVSSLIGFDPSQEAYHRLFRFAWNACLPCVARVVWRYACLNAATTYGMRRRIIDGVVAAISSQSLISDVTFSSEWRATASSFILGLRNSNPTQQHIPLDEDFDATILSALSHAANRASINPGEEDATKAMIVAAVNTQMRVFQNWTPRRHFADVLVEAFQTDQEWTSSGARYGDESMEWLFKRSPAVPLRRKTSLRAGIQSSRNMTMQRTDSMRKRASMWKRSPAFQTSASWE